MYCLIVSCRRHISQYIMSATYLYDLSCHIGRRHIYMIHDVQYIMSTTYQIFIVRYVVDMICVLSDCIRQVDRKNLYYVDDISDNTQRFVYCLIVSDKLIERNPPPRGGFLFTMFPHQEPCVRGPPSKDLYQVLQGGSSYTRFLMREHSK